MSIGGCPDAGREAYFSSLPTSVTVEDVSFDLCVPTRESDGVGVRRSTEPRPAFSTLGGRTILLSFETIPRCSVFGCVERENDAIEGLAFRSTRALEFSMTLHAGSSG